MLKSEPDDVFLNYALGLELFANKDTINESQALFDKVLVLNEDYVAAYYQLGKLFEVQKKNKAAMEIYNKGLEKAKLKKDNKAINEFNEAIFMLED